MDLGLIFPPNSSCIARSDGASSTTFTMVKRSLHGGRGISTIYYKICDEYVEANAIHALSYLKKHTLSQQPASLFLLWSSHSLKNTGKVLHCSLTSNQFFPCEYN